MNLEERLERLRTVMGLTKQELYDRVEISRAMVSAIRNGKRQPSVKFMRRLEDMEREEGVLLKVSAASALNQKRGGGPREMGILYGELNEASTRTHHLDVTKLPSQVLDNMFNSIGEALKQAEGDKRTPLLRMLNLVHGELQARESVGKAFLDGKQLTDDEREIALGSRAVAEHMARQRGAQESQRSDKAVLPSDSKSKPGGGVHKGKEVVSGDR